MAELTFRAPRPVPNTHLTRGNFPSLGRSKYSTLIMTHAYPKLQCIFKYVRMKHIRPLYHTLPLCQSGGDLIKLFS